MTKSIGLIGVGVMGSNIALNFSEKSTAVHVFNKSEDKINSLIEYDSLGNISGCTELAEVIESVA